MRRPAGGRIGRGVRAARHVGGGDGIEVVREAAHLGALALRETYPERSGVRTDLVERVVDAVAQAELARVDPADQVPGRLREALEDAQRLLARYVRRSGHVLQEEDGRRLQHRQPLQDGGERPPLLDPLRDRAL